MTDNKVQFNIQRIYLKDLSFESPMTPDVFDLIICKNYYLF